MTSDSAFLEAALLGYRHQLDEIEAKMAEIRSLLRTGSLDGPARGTVSAAPAKKRTISAAGRRRIAEAQRKRWAAQKGVKETPARKRQMSAAGRKRIADAAKKRWAALRAQKAAAR
jgi:hypothetical protein